jgi:hypothetical protein
MRRKFALSNHQFGIVKSFNEREYSVLVESIEKLL